jgi:NlpC/P60 family putative phage cell wall peptidase
MIGVNSKDFSEDIVRSVRQWIGTPYQHQASVKQRGCDCLGLVRGVWRDQVGPEPEAMLDYGPSWGDTSSVEILERALERYFEPMEIDPTKAGCVISFRMRKHCLVKHVGITMGYVGEQALMAHSYNNRGVVLAPLNAAWLRRCAGQYNFPRRIV